MRVDIFILHTLDENLTGQEAEAFASFRELRHATKTRLQEYEIELPECNTFNELQDFVSGLDGDDLNEAYVAVSKQEVTIDLDKAILPDNSFSMVGAIDIPLKKVPLDVVLFIDKFCLQAPICEAGTSVNTGFNKFYYVEDIEDGAGNDHWEHLGMNTRMKIKDFMDMLKETGAWWVRFTNE